LDIQKDIRADVRVELSVQQGKGTVKTNPCFRYEGKTEEERNLIIFKDIYTNNHINGELSTRPFH